ncbi:MAG: tetratricopeptide repeat protein, partial [Bacteroidetes bacterium]|nr:tetratricopeptide repeat protein [Bacteroidota bacterium]
MKRSVSILFLVFFALLDSAGCPLVVAQSLEIHRLEQRLAKMEKNDTARIGTMLLLGQACLPDQAERAAALGREALTLAERLKSARHRAAALSLIGSCCIARRDYREAIEAYTDALSVAEQLKETRTKMHALYWLGFVLDLSGESAKSLEYFERALEIAQRSADHAA